jgi:protein-S-isoprenylcysteine O-methyltransferase Ste14
MMALQVFSYSLPFEFLKEHPFVWCICSLLMLLLMVFYVWCNLSFGVAFSNLSNRGIVASGPYRFLRHPAYSSKVIVWWLCEIPVCLSHNFADSLCSIVGMLVVSSVFLLRALTEECHLLADPYYRDYCKLVRWRFIPRLI